MYIIEFLFHLQAHYFLGEEGHSCSKETLINNSLDCENAAKYLNIQFDNITQNYKDHLKGFNEHETGQEDEELMKNSGITAVCKQGINSSMEARFLINPDYKHLEHKI